MSIGSFDILGSQANEPHPGSPYIVRVDLDPPRRQTQFDTVCIVGMSQSRLDWVYDGHAQGCEVWGLNRGNFSFGQDTMARFTRWFQIHPFSGMMGRYQSLEYLEWLKVCPIPLYMEVAMPTIPASVAYPFAQVAAAVGSNYFATNTIGYMLGLAILEGFKEIRLYGINMGDQDLGDRYARPSIEFLLGLAAGRGAKVWVPDESALLKGNLYARTVDIKSTDVYALMNTLRAYVERMPFGLDRVWLNEAVIATEKAYLAATAGGAHHP